MIGRQRRRRARAVSGVLCGVLAACGPARAPAAQATGDATASVDEAPRVHRVRVPVAHPGGSVAASADFAVPGGAGERYVSARIPGGATRMRLVALDVDGRVIGSDEGSDSLGMPTLEGLPNVARLRVESLDGRPGWVHVYANDAGDADGDGLGARLERALGTCDAIEQPGCGDGPLGAFFRAVPGGTADSDRDGLSDAEELWGVDGPYPLDLPGWGADPRHKDLFVEADYRKSMGSPQLSEADIAAVAAIYLQGSAEDLQNPDGKPGVHLHVDAGFDPEDPAHAALMGDWGGSNAVATRDYHRAARQHLAPGRKGRFRHLLVRTSGTGQGKLLGDHFTFNRNYHRVRVFAHELGHTLGLRHYGQTEWGAANCKPNYRSLMNYVYQNEPGVGFARGVEAVLNPRMLFEREGLGVADPSFLNAPPFELHTEGRAVDFNRDGRISDQPVRGAATWATYKSCGELARGAATLHEGPIAPTTPALIATDATILALWVGADAALHVRSAESSGPDAQGSCPLGDAIDTRCSDWSAVRSLPAPAQLTHVAALAHAGSTATLALVDGDARLWLQTLDQLDDREQGPRAGTPQRVASKPVRGVPGLSTLPVDAARFGSDSLLNLVFRSDGDQLWQVLFREATGPFVVRPLRDLSGRALTSAFAPGLARLGSGEVCGAFPDAEGFIRIYCYEPGADAWADLTESAFYAGLGPRTSARVGLAFHRYRHADGSTVDPGGQAGALYLAFTDAGDRHYPNMPWLLVSDALDATRPANPGLHFRVRGQLINQWTTLVPGAGVALHEDASLSALKALLPLGDAEQAKLQMLPLVDGSYGANLGSGNDFRVMATGICTGLRGKRACGAP